MLTNGQNLKSATVGFVSYEQWQGSTQIGTERLGIEPGHDRIVRESAPIYHTLRSRWEEIQILPLPDFPDSSNTASDVDAKLSVAYSAVM